MNTKYDWSNISKQVKFIVIDSDGTEYHLKKKPKFELSNRYKTGSWFFNKSSVFAWFDYKHVNDDGCYPDFAESLEERPIVANDGMHVALGEMKCSQST